MRLSRPLVSILPIVLSLVLIAAGLAAADRAVEDLRASVTRVLDILHDPRLQRDSDGRDAALGSVMRETFDFDEMARGTLGRYWGERSRGEQHAFVSLFTRLLERAYLAKVDIYRDARITYAERPRQGSTTVVRTTIIPTHGAELPVDYHMRHLGARWLIHDVVVDGVSVVDNYRAQFLQIIRASSYGELVAKLQALEGRPTEPAGRSR